MMAAQKEKSPSEKGPPVPYSRSLYKCDFLNAYATHSKGSANIMKR